MIGEIDKKHKSGYQPSSPIREFTSFVQKDYNVGTEILNRAYVELNDRSVIEDENRGQLMFNAFVDVSNQDPMEDWKWRGTRSMARNKGIAMHANLMANYLLPIFVAQNQNDETDRDFSEIMRNIIEWMASPTNSNYQASFLQVGFGMLTNPVTYLGAEFVQVMQTIREKQKDGRYTKKDIIDEVLSGFKAPIWSATQILITNAFERNMQKQRRIIKRDYIEYGEAEAQWHDHPNWKHVFSGMKSIYNADDDLFYDIKDDSHPHLVSRDVPLSRRDDSEVPFLGGIYMGNKNVMNNPMKHRDNRGAPKYNVVPFGYHRIGQHFFFYKSMMNALGWDNALYDAMSENVMNRAILETELPIAVTGTDQIDSSVVFPNSVVALENPDARVIPLVPNSNAVAGYNALRETEKSMNEESVNETISGSLPDKEQKVGNVARAEAHAKKIIGVVGKSLAESVVLYGDLMKDIAINHITVPEVEELTGGKMKLKYRSFLLENKTIGGKIVNKKIRFDESLIGKQITKDEKKTMGFELLKEAGFPNNKDSLSRVNPEMFAKFKYLTRVDVEEMFAKNQEYWQAVLTNLYPILRQDPLVDAEGLLRKLLQSYFQSEGEALVRKQPLPPVGGVIPGQDKGNQFGQQTQGRQLNAAASGVV